MHTGSRSFSEVTLGNVFKLFPQARLCLNVDRRDELDAKISELVAGLPQKQKLDLIVELSRMTADKSQNVADNATEKIG